MRSFVTLPALAVLLSPPCVSLDAQTSPVPKELAKFDDLLGTWTGSGTSSEAPGEPAGEWKGTMTYKKILAGYFIQEDVKVDLAPGVHLAFRTIHGYDDTTGQYRSVGFGNTGIVTNARVFWHEKTFLGSSSKIEEGQAVVDLWKTEIKDRNSLRFSIRRSVDGGPLFEQVVGDWKRGGKAIDLARIESPAIAPVAAELAKVERQLGSWKGKGGISPLPDLPMIPIAMTQKVAAVLGGHAFMGHVVGAKSPGAPRPYEAHSYLVWSPARKRYFIAEFDNYGLATAQDGFVKGNALITTQTLVYFGVPSAVRTVTRWAADGKTVKMKAHRASALAEPDLYFEASFERIGEKPGGAKKSKAPTAK